MREDPRQVRTLTALSAALLRLLEDEELEEITVAALCQEAGVHRTTFYNHANGIESFAVAMVTRRLDEVATVSASETDARDAYSRAMVDVLLHVAGERPLYRALLASPWGGALRVAIDERMRERVRIALDVFSGDVGADVPPYREEIVAFVSGALVGTIALWATVDDDDAQAWAQRTQRLMPEWWPIR